MITYVALFASYPAGIVVYWATREVARGKPVGKTTVTLNLILSTLGLALYVLFSVMTYPSIHSSLGPFLVGLVLIPAGYWNQAVNAIAVGHRPAVIGYSLLASEIFKLLAAFPLLFILGYGINGVILAVLVSYVSQASVSTYMLRDVMSGSVLLVEGRRWLSEAWLPLFTSLPYVVGIADTYVASIAAGNTNTTGYYQSAFAIASLVTYSFYLSSALYPVLLKGGSSKIPTMVLDFSLLFGIPMAVGASVLAPQLLALLGRRYVVASEGLVILAFSSLVYTISAIIDQVLLGRERVDIEENRNLRRYLSSDLVFVPKVNLISSVVYVGLIYVLVATSGLSVPIDLTVAEWATAQLAVSSAVLVVKLIRVKRRENLQLSPSILRYAIAAAIMGGVVYVMSRVLPSSSVGGIVSAIKLATIIFVGAAVYFSILILIDGQSRRLAAKFVKSL